MQIVQKAAEFFEVTPGGSLWYATISLKKKGRQIGDSALLVIHSTTEEGFSRWSAQNEYREADPCPGSVLRLL